MNGGEIVADWLVRHGVSALFTLCGGHIAPILVSCHKRGIRVVDTRHEATAVFAADAVSRLTGVPGVAAVTAGPGVTNSMTAVTNARLAQSPVVLLGGATAGILKGRGSLQDIDQIALVRSQMKWSAVATRVRDIPRLLTTAFQRAQEGVPGPVFLELPVDLLYEEKVVREWFGKSSGGNRLQQWYLRRYLRRQFGGAAEVAGPPIMDEEQPSDSALREVAARLASAQRPVMVVGSHASSPKVAEAIDRLGIPVYLSGMSRGLLGSAHRLQMRHRRKAALRQADLVVLAGVPADFRLGYGRDIRRGAVVISANRSAEDLKKNRRPDLALKVDPGAFLVRLAAAVQGTDREEWIRELRAADEEREREIVASAQAPAEHVNPLALCQAIDRALAPKSIIVADGGDFVSTASYIVRPRAPLSWLDPGPFGTLGVGAGFAIGAAVSRPDDERWILYGDGALGFSLAEFDTFARHRIPVIAVVANDACWTQIHREQIDVLGDDTGCMLARADYHVAAEGLGGCGLLLKDPAKTDETLQEAKRVAASGRPVLVNAWIGKSAFRKGSISM
jgi:thiamine pyrophosphate-dependent acetolactate synthase large subunit-like protein